MAALGAERAVDRRARPRRIIHRGHAVDLRGRALKSGLISMWRASPREAAPYLVALLVLAACATTPPPPPPVAPQGEDRYIVDPRLGYNGAADPGFENVWRLIQAGQTAVARPQLAELRAKNPNYLPASLAEAAIALHDKNWDAARDAIARVQ